MYLYQRQRDPPLLVFLDLTVSPPVSDTTRCLAQAKHFGNMAEVKVMDLQDGLEVLRICGICPDE